MLSLPFHELNRHKKEIQPCEHLAYAHIFSVSVLRCVMRLGHSHFKSDSLLIGCKHRSTQ